MADPRPSWRSTLTAMLSARMLVALLILDGLHYVHFTAAKFNHDVIQLPFWALAGYAYWAALRRGRVVHWLLLGLGVDELSITPALVHSLDDALRTRELVKVQLNKSAEVSAKDAANQLAGRVRAEVIQTIGKTASSTRLSWGHDVERFVEHA